MARWRSFWHRLTAFAAMLWAMALELPLATAQEAGASEEAVWQQAEQVGTAEAYEAYLEQFPLGRYTREAFRRAVEAAAREVPDPAGRAPVGGPAGRQVAEEPQPSPAATAAAERAEADDAAWREAQAVDTVDAYDAYLDAFPLGRHTREAFRRSIEAAAREPAEPETLPESVAPDVATAPVEAPSRAQEPQRGEAAALDQGVPGATPEPSPAGAVGTIAEEALWAEAQRVATAEAYEAYLERYPLGRYAGDAFRGAIDAALAEQDGDDNAAAGAAAAAAAAAAAQAAADDLGDVAPGAGGYE